MTKAKYKASGAEWIERLPEHWDEKPAFSVFDELDDKNELGRVQNVLSLSYGKIVRRDVESNFGLLPESFSTYQIVRAGDIVLRLLDLQNDHVSLRVGIVPEEGIVTSAYLAVRPQNQLDSRFAAYLLHAYDIKKVFYSFGGGCRQSMGFEDLRRLPIPLPSSAEQKRIADYLDAATGKIDRLVELRRRQMELLREQRAALIQQAVTRGLDPKAPLKDSGLPWLGKIPKHWKVAVLKWQMQITSGDSVITEALLPEPDGLSNIPAVGGNGVMGFTAKSNVPLPMLAIGRVGALCGNVHHVLPPAWITDNALMVFNVHGYSLEFLWRLLTVLNLNRLANQNAQPLITGTLVKNQRAPLPPLEEQREILEYIDAESAKTDRLLSAYFRQIELLGEYRAALIHEAVTGQKAV